jgi:hypothetical protein
MGVIWAYNMVADWWENSRRIRLAKRAIALSTMENELHARVHDLEIQNCRWRERADELECQNEGLREEVKVLNRRSRIMANELRSDPKAPTEVLPPIGQGRKF